MTACGQNVKILIEKMVLPCFRSFSNPLFQQWNYTGGTGMQKRIQPLFSPVLRMTWHDILVWIRIRWSIPLTNGSGSWIRILLFRHWPLRCQQTLILFKKFSAFNFLKVHLHHFSKIKSQKELQNSRNQGSSYYFCKMIEGSGSGSIPLTNGSGSERP